MLPAKNKILKQMSTVLLLRDDPAGGTTTIGAAGAAKGQKLIPVASTNGFAVGDTVRVGAGEYTELAVISVVTAGASITVADNLTFDHVGGEDVHEQIAYDLGDITDGGVTITGQAQTSDQQSAMRRLVYVVLNGGASLTAEFQLPGFTLQNLAAALGVPFGNVAGDGTANTPWFYATDGSDFGAEQNQSLVCIALTQDGQPVRAELWGVDFDYTVITTALKRGQLAAIPVKAVAAAGGLVTTNASAYVANTIYRATKGDVFDALTEVGLFADATVGPLATTTTAAAAAGAKVLALTAATNLVAGDWIKVNTDDVVEFHQVASIAALNVTIKGKLLRAQAQGTAVVRQQLVPFAAPSDDTGVQLTIGGTVSEQRIATRRLSIGLKLGAAPISVRFGLLDFSLANFALALGIPASAIANNRLPIGDLIGTRTIDGMYAKGLQKDGVTTSWVTCWGSSQDLSNMQAVLSQQPGSELPVTLKPASGIQFQQAA